MENIDLATLSQLQNNHLCLIPFENLDVTNGVPIALDVKSYYEKIVINGRGGFCYELNGLFYWLLKQLGYKTTLVAASVKRSDGTWSVLDTSHACLIVQLDVPYLVDVGFGDSVRVPLPFTGQVKTDVSGTYRMKKVSDTKYDLQIKQDNWQTRLRVNTKPRQLASFKEACHYNQTSPQSVFTQGDLVSLATENGRITYTKDRLIITEHNERQEMAVDQVERENILKKYFNLEL